MEPSAVEPGHRVSSPPADTASASTPEAVVAGHICLDLIPQFPAGAAGPEPGRLVNVGPALRSTGGAVSNTGLALHRLGHRISLLAKVGDDLFGDEILRIVRGHGDDLASAMVVSPGEVSSYTVVINPPGTDRSFLHCVGANSTFSAADIDVESLRGARLFHLGYPPVLPMLASDGGTGLRSVFAKAREVGMATSLDMCTVDPASEAARVNWPAYLKNVLTETDVFLPSLDEILEMLGRAGAASAAKPDPAVVRQTARQLLDWGAAVVVIKLGEHGIYVRSTADRARLERVGGKLLNAADWLDQEVWSPCFEVDVVGTTGAGDCTIAGFLAGLLHGGGPGEAADAACAVGACSVEAADATTGVQTWDQTQARLQASWPRRAQSLVADKSAH